MATGLKNCSVCGSEFLVKKPSQIRRDDGTTQFYCGEDCRESAREERGGAVCSVCGTEFEPKYAYQRGRDDESVVYFCSMECRQPRSDKRRRRAGEQAQGAMRVAIMNQKGGTGKTTTSVSLAAGLAEDGQKVLLVDLDSQGHIGISLGVEGEHTLHDVLIGDLEVQEAVVGARPNLDILTADESLADAEIELARMTSNPDRLMRNQFGTDHDYDFILLDCGPSLSLLNKNALTFAENLIVPVACDFLSLVGVRQVLRTLKKVNQALVNPIDILGILPTFYDMRNNISDESIKTLKGHFDDKVLPPIRVNTRLKEAPSEQETIFEYAPSSRGAEDYRRLVNWLVDRREQRLKAG